MSSFQFEVDSDALVEPREEMVIVPLRPPGFQLALAKALSVVLSGELLCHAADLLGQGRGLAALGVLALSLTSLILGIRTWPAERKNRNRLPPPTNMGLAVNKTLCLLLSGAMLDTSPLLLVTGSLSG